jgi:hypothetical protein
VLSADLRLNATPALPGETVTVTVTDDPGSTVEWFKDMDTDAAVTGGQYIPHSLYQTWTASHSNEIAKFPYSSSNDQYARQPLDPQPQ